MPWHTAALLATLTLLAPASVLAGEMVAVELCESASVEGDAITLGQLARITPAERAEELGAIEIGPAPLAGSSRRLTRGYLKMRLRRSGVACGEIAFSGAESVEVRRTPGPAAAPRQTTAKIEAAGATGARHQDLPRPLPTIDRGTRVRLTVICGAVSIGAEATLLEAAVVGERAKMRVEQTRETVVAQIVQPSEAVIRRE